jgi:sugar fermentation stimulation protein A
MSRRTGLAEFPDSVTTRGAKHLEELARVADSGDRAALLFLIQRTDAKRMTIADDIDPAYMRALREALGRGVEVYGYKSKIDTAAISLTDRVPIRIAGTKPARERR